MTKVGKGSSQQRSLKKMGATEILSSTAKKERNGAARVYALISLRTVLLYGLCLLLACSRKGTMAPGFSDRSAVR